MILVYLKNEELCSFECDTLEEVRETIVERYIDEDTYFSGIDRLEDEDENLLDLDIENLNSELEDSIDQAKKEMCYNDMSDIRKDYLRNIL